SSAVMKAELEFLLEAARSAELHRLEHEYEKAQFDQLRSIFCNLGAANPEFAAVEFASWMRSEAWTFYLAPAGIRKQHTLSSFLAKISDCVHLASSGS